jgi:hypothetical protein
MSYDRDAALSYARQHWLSVASDGYIAGEFGARPYLQVPPGTVFVHDAYPSRSEHALLPDGTEIPWSKLDDCTHFMSCVLGRPPGGIAAGGLDIPSDFPSGPYGILGASRFVRTLLDRGYVEVTVVEDKSSPGIESLSPGDLVGYYKRSGHSYAHLTLYAGDGNIICHSYCRSDDPACTWDHNYRLGLDDDDWEWRLLRMRDD